MATGIKTRTKAKKATPPPVVEVDETEDDDLEELDEDDIEEAKPAPKKSTAQQVTFGVSDLAKLLVKKGHKVDARGLRTLIRKMARDGSGRVDREIVAGNRTRYDWSGPKDPEVQKIIKAFLGGELEQDKQEKLQALKDRKAAKDKAAGKLAGVTKKKKTKVAPPVVEEDDDDDDDLELDEDDE